MEEQFIPYELASELKGLGFNGECFGAFTKRGKFKRCTSDYWTNESLEALQDYFGKQSYYCLASLWQQAFDWFRDTYNLHTLIHHFTHQPIGKEVWKDCYQYFINGTAYHPYYRTYQEARLACLQKLIKLCKR